MPKQEPIEISGIWLRSSGNNIEVLVERDGQWYSVIREYMGGSISHITEPLGILNARLDTVTKSNKE